MTPILLLYFIVFVSGGVLMGLEIVGSRVLAPYFGNSIFVWGSLISVVLAALSLGYVWGGRLSQRDPSFLRLLALLVVPGILIFLLPFVYPAVNAWIAGKDFGSRLNPLLASTLYFLLPSLFLGTVSPYAIRLSVTALASVGNTAGTLYALSTCGSIFGTLFTAFYLIPMMGVSNIIHALGVTLVLMSMISWLITRSRETKRAVTFALLAVISAVQGTLGLARARTLFEKDSMYHRIRVEEDGNVRRLYFDRTLQSAMNLADPTALELLYSRFASLGLALRPDAQRVLALGLGGGSIPKKYSREFPYMKIDAVDIDPAVIEVAKKYFHFKETKHMKVYAKDGRLFLSRSVQPYDVMILDAYYADTVPFHLVTREFFSMAAKKLTDEGVLVINLIGAVVGQRSRLVRAVIKTLQGLFPQIYVFPTYGASERTLETVQNVIVLASKDSRRFTPEEFEQRAAALGSGLFPEPLQKIPKSYYAEPLPLDDVPLLTDDYAPTDNLLHH